MAERNPTDRGRGGLLRLAGAQAILVGGFAAFLGLGFFRLAGLIFGGAALVGIGVILVVVGLRRGRDRPRQPRSRVPPT